MWKLQVADGFEPILPLYRKIFDDEIDLPEIRERTGQHQTHVFLLLKMPEQAIAGFAFFRGKDGEVELWQAGVIPEMRRQGGGTFLLDRGEKEMARIGYRKITVHTFNRWNIMLSMLFRREYRLVSTNYSQRRDDLKMYMVRELRERRELRYSITERCNFNCLFCHNEGLGKESRPWESDDHVLRVIAEAVRLGHTDITFTGGEPLLKKERLNFLLEGLAKLEAPPDITLVTNAALMDQHIIKRLTAYPGEKKINLSLHATDEEAFMTITRTAKPGVFEKLRQNVRECSAAGIMVKVNYVVLQGLNHQSVIDAVHMAHDMGASAIKFIELLVLPENPDDYKMYYDADAICEQLETIGYGPDQAGPRKREFRFRMDTRFIIEVQQLTCSLGCSHCLEVRDRTFSSDLQYHPCFIRSKKRYKIDDPAKLDNILSKGDRIINGYASRYMDSSPTLVQKEIYVPSKKELFYTVDDVIAVREFLGQNQFGLVAAFRFHEEYFRPRNRPDEWDRFERVLKIGWDYHHENRVELIYTDHQYTITPEGLITKTRFLDPAGPIRQKSARFARHFLDRLNFEHFMTLEWEIEIWQRKQLKLFLAGNGPLSTLKIDWSKSNVAEVDVLLADYPGSVKPLLKPLPEFMQAGDRQEISEVRLP